MSELEILKTLEAYKLGRPIPRTEKILTQKLPDENCITIAFVRMGGESVPWGAAIRVGAGKTETFICPDPRKRTELSISMRAFGDRLADALRNLSETGNFQVWLPNQTHLDMLHFLALRYMWTKFNLEGEEVPGEHANGLRRLGRTSNFLFSISQYPGQTLLATATEALKSAYFFPADRIRQSHLGFLMALLETSGDLASRMGVATTEERFSISTSLDPDLEEKMLERLVDAHGAGDRNAGKQIGDILSRELSRRIELTAQARKVLSKDPRKENPGLKALQGDTFQLFQRSYLEVEEQIKQGGAPFIPSPAADKSPAYAASRYIDQEEASGKAESELLQHDQYLQDAAVSEGNAISGTVEAADRTKVGAKNYIRWVVKSRADLPLRIREGDKVSLLKFPTSSLRLQEITQSKDGTERIIELDVIAPKTAKGGIDMGSGDLVGQKILLLPVSFSGMKFNKSKAIFNKDAPGAWVIDSLKAAAKKREALDE